MVDNKALTREEKRRFTNMKNAMSDILQALENEYDLEFVTNLRKRVERSKSKEELRFIMDGMMVIAGFANPLGSNLEE
jgi:hypothetical protein